MRTSASSDGKLIALTYVPNPPKVAAPRLGIIPFEGGDLAKTFDLPADVTYEGLLHWTTDSQAITYTRHNAGSKIWIQPIDGSPFRELADFKTDNIWEFGWSADGKQLAVARRRQIRRRGADKQSSMIPFSMARRTIHLANNQRKRFEPRTVIRRLFSRTGSFASPPT